VKYFATVRRWLRHPAQRNFELKSKPFYWKIRRALLKAQHFALRRRFYASETARNLRQSSQILALFARRILGNVALALLLFALLAFADSILDGQGIVFLASHWPRLAAMLLRFSQSAAHQYGSIQNLLNTIVQLTGLFLTLYFTAISVIASTVYARVPGDVRTLAVDEKFGNVYIRIVAILGAVSILYLLGGIVGMQIGLIGLTAIGALSIGALFSFLFLGRRTFNFFQPTAFVQYILNDLAKWIELAANRKATYQTHSLQDYYRRRAETTLGTYRNIVFLATKEEFHRIEADALVTLLRGTIETAVFYVERKASISSESLWFEKIAKHVNWLTASHVQIDMALRSGRPVDPELVPNFLWLEEWLQTILNKTSSALADRADSQHWFEFANQLYYRVERLAYMYAIDEALLYFGSQWKEIGSRLHSCTLEPTAGSEESDRLLSFHVGAIAFVFSDLMAISIGFARRVEQITEDWIHGLARDLLGDARDLVFSSQLPRTVITDTESLLLALRAEKFVEQRIVTPEWYVAQMLALSFIKFIKATCETLVTQAEQTLQERLAELPARHLFVAQIISSGIETCDKLHAHFGRIRERVEMLNTLRRVQDVPWVDVDWKYLHERIDQLYRRLMLSAAEILFRLDSLPRSRYWPDFFGQMYTFLAREAYYAMVRGDTELFGSLFPPLFASSISANQKLREELKDRDVNTLLTWSSAPIYDVVELSGYAKLFFELDGKLFYDIVRNTWNAYLASVKDERAVLKFVAALMDYRLRGLFTAARELERIAWQQSFEALLRERGLLGNDWEYQRSRVKMHPSRWIQEFTRGGVRFEHASDVFLVEYVMPKLSGENVEFPYSAVNLARELARNAAPSSTDDPDTR